MRRRAAYDLLLCLLALLSCGTPARQEVGGKTWTEVSGSLFVLRTDADPDHARALAEDLELFLAVVRTATDFDFDRVPHPLRMYAIEDADLQRGLWLGATMGRLGEQNDTAYGSIVIAAIGRYRDATRSVLCHELTHFLLDQTDLYVPRWYHEGLAEFLSTIRRREDLVSIGHVTNGRLQSLAVLGRQPLAAVVSAYAYPKDYEERLSFYATAWLFVHYLQTGRTEAGDATHHAGVDYLERLGRGEAWDAAFAAAFGGAPETLNDVLEAHRKNLDARLLRLFHLDARDLAIANPGPVAVASPASVAADLAEVLLTYEHGGSTDNAIGMLESALASDPDHAEARATLAWAKARRYRPPAAENELARALARGDASARVHLQAARVHRVRAEFPSELDRARMAEARTHFRRATEIDPGLAAAWAELGETYALDRADDPPGPGVEALERAHAMLPSDSRVLLALAKLRERAGETDVAREHLQLVLRWSWSEEQREEAQALLDSLAE